MIRDEERERGRRRELAELADWNVRIKCFVSILLAGNYKAHSISASNDELNRCRLNEQILDDDDGGGGGGQSQLASMN